MPGIAILDPNNSEVVLGTAKHPYVVQQELLALSTPKKNAIFADVTTGSPPLWAATFNSPDEIDTFNAFIPATSVGATLDEKMAAVAVYLFTHPLYLQAPAFDPTINIVPYIP